MSFTIHWKGGGKAVHIGDGVNFRATVFEDTASIHWSAHEKGFSFVSKTSTSNFAEIGREHNGRFR